MSKHLLFAIPCSAHPESTGAQAGTADTQAVADRGGGAYDDVSRCRKQESLRVLLSFYRLHSLLFTCDFDCLKLSSLKSWVSKAPGFLLPYLTSSSPAHLFSILGLVSPTRSQGRRETERPKSDFWLRKKVNICFLTTSPDPNSLAYCFRRRSRLSGWPTLPLWVRWTQLWWEGKILPTVPLAPWWGSLPQRHKEIEHRGWGKRGLRSSTQITWDTGRPLRGALITHRSRKTRRATMGNAGQDESGGKPSPLALTTFTLPRKLPNKEKRTSCWGPSEGPKWPMLGNYYCVS